MKIEIDNSVLRDIIEQDYNLYDIYIGDLDYQIISNIIQYTFIDSKNERQYGLVDIKRYIENKREKSLNKLL